MRENKTTDIQYSSRGKVERAKIRYIHRKIA